MSSVRQIRNKHVMLTEHSNLSFLILLKQIHTCIKHLIWSLNCGINCHIFVFCRPFSVKIKNVHHTGVGVDLSFGFGLYLNMLLAYEVLCRHAGRGRHRGHKPLQFCGNLKKSAELHLYEELLFFPIMVIKF